MEFFVPCVTVSIFCHLLFLVGVTLAENTKSKTKNFISIFFLYTTSAHFLYYFWFYRLSILIHRENRSANNLHFIWRNRTNKRKLKQFQRNARLKCSTKCMCSTSDEMKIETDVRSGILRIVKLNEKNTLLWRFSCHYQLYFLNDLVFCTRCTGSTEMKRIGADYNLILWYSLWWVQTFVSTKI